MISKCINIRKICFLETVRIFVYSYIYSESDVYNIVSPFLWEILTLKQKGVGKSLKRELLLQMGKPLKWAGPGQVEVNFYDQISKKIKGCYGVMESLIIFFSVTPITLQCQ